LIRCELQAAIREFYRMSSAWRDTVGPYTVAANQEYVYLNPVDPYANVQLVYDGYLQYDAERKTPLTKLTRPPLIVNPAEPHSFFCAEPYTLRLSPVTPTALGRVLYVYAALVPPQDTERLPQIAVTHHFEGILAGALSRLYGMNNKPWTDLAYAAERNREFRRKIAAARDEANRGQVVADTPFRFPRFA
jgi:hypothetical protein